MGSVRLRGCHCWLVQQCGITRGFQCRTSRQCHRPSRQLRLDGLIRARRRILRKVLP